jgi:hypothetical protein
MSVEYGVEPSGKITDAAPISQQEVRVFVGRPWPLAAVEAMGEVGPELLGLMIRCPCLFQDCLNMTLCHDTY